MFVMWIDHISIPYCCVLRRVAGWVAGWVGNGVAGGCWDDEITSDEMDHSRKFPAFSTSKHINTYLVGGIPTPLKNMKVNVKDYSHILGKIKNVPNHQPDIIDNAR